MPQIEEDARETIISAAEKVFGQFGFKKTTMEEIAQAAYKGKSAIYYYFKSKEDLFQAVVEKEGKLLRQEVEKAIASKKTPKTKLRTYFVTRMKAFSRHPNLYNAIKDNDLQHYRFISTIRKNALQFERKMVEKLLKEGMDKNMFVIKDLELTAEGLLTAFSGVESLWNVETQFPRIERSIDIVLDMLFYGIMH